MSGDPWSDCPRCGRRPDFLTGRCPNGCRPKNDPADARRTMKEIHKLTNQEPRFARPYALARQSRRDRPARQPSIFEGTDDQSC